MESLKIGEAAKRTGLNPKLIRYYERIGLIPALRRSPHEYASAGYRLFSLNDVESLRLVAVSRQLGFSLQEARGLIQAVDDACCGSALPRLHALLEQKLQELKSKIALLGALHEQLERLAGEVEARVASSSRSVDCPADASPCQCTFGDFQPINLVLNPR